MARKGTTIKQQIIFWLEDHSGWWTRAEIATGAGRSKTSQFIRTIEALVEDSTLIRDVAHENGRDVFVYGLPHTPSQDLPF